MDHLHSFPSLATAVRNGVLSQLTDHVLADSVTQAVLDQIDRFEDEALLRVLLVEPEEEPVDLNQFLIDLKR